MCGSIISKCSAFSGSPFGWQSPRDDGFVGVFHPDPFIRIDRPCVVVPIGDAFFLVLDGMPQVCLVFKNMAHGAAVPFLIQTLNLFLYKLTAIN